LANINQLYETSLPFASGVELARGPGSALYGSNAVHGTVNVVTDRDPARAAAEVGSFGRYAVSGSGPIGGGLSAGLSFRHEDGWRDAARLDEAHALLGHEGDIAGWKVRSRLAVVNLEQETAGFAPSYEDKAAAKRNANPEAYRDSKVVRAQARLEHTLGDAWSVQATPYARWIDTDLLLHFFPSQALEETAQSGGGVQTALYWDPGPNLSVIVGVDADRTTGSFRERQSIPSVGTYPQGVHYDYEVDASVLAAYSQARWRFAPDTQLVAGVRAERSRYDYDNRTASDDFGRFRRPADRSDTFDTLTPKLGVVHALSEFASVWANFARGARAPQVSDLYSLQTTQTPGDQDSETIDSVEVGWRRRFPDGGSLELAVYAMDKENAAFRNADGFTVTDAATEHLGAELSGSMPITSTLTVSGWVTYAEHTYAFSDAVARAGESIRAGNEVDSAPNWLWNARLAWRPHPQLETEAAWTHVGAYATNADNSRTYPGHDVVDLRARYAVTPKWSVTAAVRNVFDTRYAERADFAFGSDRYFPGEPQAFTLGLALSP
jgi:iron complex outermembrane recepter protein